MKSSLFFATFSIFLFGVAISAQTKGKYADLIQRGKIKINH